MLTEHAGLGRANVVGNAAPGCLKPFPQLCLGAGRHVLTMTVRGVMPPRRIGRRNAGYGVSRCHHPQTPNPRFHSRRSCRRPGLGTRFLPATKTVPKELLPVVDTPGIELVAAEAAEAGAERLIIDHVRGQGRAVVAHFVEDLVLEGTLEARGNKPMLAKVRRAPGLIKVESVVQAEPLGLGHAISCVEPTLTADEDAVMVLLPDDLVLPTGVLETMSQVRAKYGGTVLCAIEVTPEEISAYGVFDVEPVPGGDSPDVLKVNGMVEKPKAKDAPSMLAAAGRYVLDRAIFDALRRIDRGAGGEVQLTDGIALLIKEGHPVHVVVHHGSRHDLGNPGGYLKAAG